MENAVTALTTTVSADALWDTFATAVPYLGVIVVFGFGIYLVRRMVKGVSKGKAKI